MGAPKVRELRVTDIRCRAEGCGAGPGDLCVAPLRTWIHRSRLDEYHELRDAGWQWQEVDPHDAGAKE